MSDSSSPAATMDVAVTTTLANNQALFRTHMIGTERTELTIIIIIINILNYNKRTQRKRIDRDTRLFWKSILVETKSNEFISYKNLTHA